MTKTITLITTLILAALIYSVGMVAAEAQNLNGPASPPAVVVVTDGEHVPNIEPPTRLDIDGVDAPTCDDMGGQFTDLSYGLGRCEGVDY